VVVGLVVLLHVFEVGFVGDSAGDSVGGSVGGSVGSDGAGVLMCVVCIFSVDVEVV